MSDKYLQRFSFFYSFFAMSPNSVIREHPLPWFAYCMGLCAWREIWELGTSLDLFIKVVVRRAQKNESWLFAHDRQTDPVFLTNNFMQHVNQHSGPYPIFSKNCLPLCFPAAAWDTLRHNLSSKTMLCLHSHLTGIWELHNGHLGERRGKK